MQKNQFFSLYPLRGLRPRQRLWLCPIFRLSLLAAYDSNRKPSRTHRNPWTVRTAVHLWTADVTCDSSEKRDHCAIVDIAVCGLTAFGFWKCQMATRRRQPRVVAEAAFGVEHRRHLGTHPGCHLISRRQRNLEIWNTNLRDKPSFLFVHGCQV